MFSECIKSIIDRYGRRVTILSSNNKFNGKTAKAFIQPLRHKDSTYMGGKFKNLGQIKGSKYLYIGSSDIRLDECPINTIIKNNENKFVLKRAEKVYFKDDIFYIWAILQPYVEED